MHYITYCSCGFGAVLLLSLLKFIWILNLNSSNSVQNCILLAYMGHYWHVKINVLYLIFVCFCVLDIIWMNDLDCDNWWPMKSLWHYKLSSHNSLFSGPIMEGLPGPPGPKGPPGMRGIKGQKGEAGSEWAPVVGVEAPIYYRQCRTSRPVLLVRFTINSLSRAAWNHVR